MSDFINEKFGGASTPESVIREFGEYWARLSLWAHDIHDLADDNKYKDRQSL